MVASRPVNPRIVWVLVFGWTLAATACRDDAARGDNAFGRALDSVRKAARAPSRPATTAASLLADSAAADSVALATLPDRIATDFAIMPLLTDSVTRRMSGLACLELSDSTDAEVRQRIRGAWPEGWTTVLFVRADRASGMLRRVELLRGSPAQRQRGYIWDASGDETTAVEWATRTSRPETYTLPPGTPAPRALRALGRRLLTMPCGGTESR